ncbi:MAG TPA: lipoprotein [Steroidobacteraceae bacterium]|jgi:predicted small lipoprotein YifL|nr:lipoprotein [Steroidobacteraceae bacterium]
MFIIRTALARRSWPALALAACALVSLSGCGQRGPLYMPDRNARVLTRPAASAPASAPSSAPR